ncbi:MAG: carboxylesterase/lipase family protein [Alphaproteobacteria bacterium]|nr:carboxylesterase/lipase family protein [Alphaproteobacteria bacterium]
MNIAESVTVLADAPCGKLEGSRRGGVSTFKGIPFATAKRWHMPERAEPWSGVRSARAAGAVAPQNPTPLEGLIAGGGKTVQSEDCLFLNVWTPSCDGAKRPVMVWIHGGAFSTGAGSVGLYSGKNLVTAGDVVVVTINYRLSSLGFLRLTDITNGRIRSTGAEGIADQIAALGWMRDNIAAFGGDPGNVTIFGESAGGMSVACLLASPAARGLFHKAISQSGSAHIARPREHANRVADVFLRHLGGAGNDLERAPVEALLKAQADLVAEVDNQDPHKLGSMALQPVVDGDVLPLWPIEAVRAGSSASVPMIAGTTTEEWKLWTALDAKFHTMDEGKLERWAERMFGDDAAALLAADKDGTPYERYVSMQTDRAFREPTRRLLAAQSAQAPVYEYVFDWRSPAMGGAFGACHAMELGFVFGTHSLPGADNFFGKGPEADAISLAMIQAWTSFARTGVPKADGVEAWPHWSKASPAAMVFGADSRAAHVSRFELPKAWAALPDRLVGP